MESTGDKEAHRAWDLLSRPLLALNLGIVAAANVAYFALRDQLPGRLVVHRTIAGEPTRYGSPGELWMVGGALVLTSLLPFLAALLSALAPDPDHQGNPRLRGLNWEYRRRSVRMVEGIILGENLAIAFLWLGTAYAAIPGNEWLVMHVVKGMALLVLLGILVPVSILAPGLMRAGKALQEARPSGPRPEHFKGGLFYVNRDDPALWVPKPAGLGYTLNLGQPRAWLVLALLLLGPVVLVTVLSVMR